MLSILVSAVASTLIGRGDFAIYGRPDQVRSNYTIECAHGSYKFEIVQRLKSQPSPLDHRKNLVSTVELVRFKRSSAPVSRKLNAQLENVFEQFESIRSVSVWCGVSHKDGKRTDLLQIDLGGPHRDDVDEAKVACRNKNLVFDGETRRKMSIEDDAVEVHGAEIGRCYEQPTQAIE